MNYPPKSDLYDLLIIIVSPIVRFFPIRFQALSCSGVTENFLLRAVTVSPRFIW